jgi:hypothetical protein
MFLPSIRPKSLNDPSQIPQSIPKGCRLICPRRRRTNAQKANSRNLCSCLRPYQRWHATAPPSPATNSRHLVCLETSMLRGDGGITRAPHHGWKTAVFSDVTPRMSLVLQSFLQYPNSCQGTSPPDDRCGRGWESGLDRPSDAQQSDDKKARLLHGNSIGQVTQMKSCRLT